MPEITKRKTKSIPENRPFLSSKISGHKYCLIEAVTTKKGAPRMQQPAVMLDVVQEEFEHFETSIWHFMGEEVWRQLSQPYPTYMAAILMLLPLKSVHKV